MNPEDEDIKRRHRDYKEPKEKLTYEAFKELYLARVKALGRSYLLPAQQGEGHFCERDVSAAQHLEAHSGE